MQPILPKLKCYEYPDNKTARLSFMEFHKLKLIDTVLLISDKQLYQSSQFDIQTICEELKKEIKQVKSSKSMLCFFSG